MLKRDRRFRQLVQLAQNTKILATNLINQIKLVLKRNKKKDVSYDSE